MATPRTKKPEPKKIEAGIKMPVSFEQFKKSPIAAIAFLSVIGITYLYMDQKKMSQNSMGNCEEEKRGLMKTIEKKDSVIISLITQNAIINATK
jgi:hypothetical protein